MKPFMLILVLVACLLAACGQNTQAPFEENELSSQAVLPNAYGVVFYAQQYKGPIIGVKPYNIYRHDQDFGEPALIYSDFREIQSVAGSMDGDPITSRGSVVVSMRETTNPRSDFEIFLITFDEFGRPTTFQLTSDSVDNTNVSVSGDRSRIVYNQSVSGKDTVVLRTRTGFASYNSVILSATHPQRHASISINGQYITFVRDWSNGIDHIMKYTIATNTYLWVATSRASSEYPSISSGGEKVMWLEKGQNGYRDVVRLKNLTTGTTQIILREPIIAHPFMTADGRFMTYQVGLNIMTKDLITGQVQALTQSLTLLITYYSPMWQMVYQPPVQVGQLRVNISGLPSGQKRVKVTGPNNFNSGLFGGSSRTFSKLTPGTYTVSAQGFVLGVPGKPTCKMYSAVPTQSVTVVASQTTTVNITYQVELCPIDPPTP